MPINQLLVVIKPEGQNADPMPVGSTVKHLCQRRIQMSLRIHWTFVPQTFLGPPRHIETRGFKSRHVSQRSKNITDTDIGTHRQVFRMDIG